MSGALTAIVYVGPCGHGVEIEHPPGGRTVCRRGEPVQLPNRIARSLLEQVDAWKRADLVEAEPESAPEPESVSDPAPEEN